MSETVNTVKVKPWSDDQGDYVLINAADFNPERHELFEAAELAAPAEPAVKPARKPKE